MCKQFVYTSLVKYIVKPSKNVMIFLYQPQKNTCSDLQSRACHDQVHSL